ncbi:phosphotransferase family protein [Streptomyces sp. NPDC059582]|uniref:phosphotransferase family protein n=1 Tax=Streptomyces sp. NPDC059582 TaxID=3346875 RepID=UPI0036B8E327
MGVTHSTDIPLTGTELDSVAAVMRAAGVEVTQPLAAELITGGRSNVTFRLTDGVSRWVLRMPPRAGRTPSAHDVAREHRVTAALAATGIPVARPVALCKDESLLGGAFSVAEFVPGRTVRTRDQLAALDDASLDTTVDQLLNSLAALHRVDHVRIGLEGFGRPGGYAERQLRRWWGQWQLIGSAELDGLARDLNDRLAGSIPKRQTTGIVHGDYRIDNVILSPDSSSAPQVAAIVDWELSTIGDAVADVAMMCAYRDPAFDLIVGSPSAWASPRLPEPAALAAAYERAGDIPLTDWDFHLALAYFKIAVIAAGIDHRARAGAARGPGFDTAAESVATFLELGRTTLGAHR